MSNSDDNDLFDLQFTPSWARQSPDAHHERLLRNERKHEDWEDKRRPRRDGDFDGRRRDNRRDDPRSKPPRRDAAAPAADFRPPREHFKRDQRDDRAPRHDSPRPHEQPPRPAFEPLPVDVRFLPEHRALGSIMRKVQTTHFAYPLRDMARLFLDNLSACMVRVDPLKGQDLTFWTCKHCGVPALSEDEIRRHFIAKHFNDFFEAVEIESEPPAGNFICVAKCGVTGTLLGPPNHHSYAVKMQEILRGRCAGMDPETYRSRIIMVREPEAIEQWRQEAARRTLYRLKAEKPAEHPTPEAASEAPAEPVDVPTPDTSPAIEYTAAENLFLNDILPKKIASAAHFTCMTDAARQTPDHRLNQTLREAFYRELRYPSSLFFALRGAFHHRKMHVFRVNDAKGADFVMMNAPSRLDPVNTVAEIRDLLTYVAEHSGCTRSEVLQHIKQTTPPDNVNHVISQLLWLIERGHLIEFYNSVLAIPANPGEFPAFRYLPGERAGAPRIHGETQADTTHAASEPAPVAAEPEAIVTESAPVATASEPVTTEPAPVEPPAAEAAPDPVAESQDPKADPS